MFNVNSAEFHFMSRFTCHWQDEEGLFERVAGALVAWWSETGSEGGRPLQDGGGDQSDRLQLTLPPFPIPSSVCQEPPAVQIRYEYSESIAAGDTLYPLVENGV